MSESRRLVWLIWTSDSSGNIWLAEAWDDDSICQDEEGWIEARSKATREAADTGYGEVRVQQVWVPAVYELFETPVVEAEVVE